MTQEKKSSGGRRRWLLAVIFMGAAIIVVPFLFEKVVIKALAELLVGQTTGFKLRIDDIHVNPFAGDVSVRGFRLTNPPAFLSGTFIEMPLCRVDVGVSDYLFRKSLRLEKVELRIEEVSVVKNEVGETNLSALPLPRSAAGDTSLRQTEHREGREAMPFFIDELHLTLGKVRYLEYSRGSSEPREYHFDLRVKDKVIRNVTDPRAVLGIIALEIAYNTTIGHLGIDIGSLENRVAGALANTTALTRKGKDYVMAKKVVLEEAGGELVVDALAQGKQVSDAGSQVIAEATVSAEKVTERSKQLVSNAARGFKDIAKSLVDEKS